MRAIKVGDLYHPQRRTWPEGAAWVYHEGRYELLLRFGQPSRAETEAIGEGSSRVAFFEHGSALIGLYRFGAREVPWSDVPMEPHAWIAMPTEEQAPLAIALIDARNGIVRALRTILLPAGFCAALAAAAGRARSAYDPQRWARDFAEAETSLTSDEMARAASHVAEHGPKQPARRA